MKTKSSSTKGKKTTSEDAQIEEGQSISSAWPPFSQKLASALEGLVEDEVLIVSLKHSNQFVQFAAQGSFGMRVETTSNFYRDHTHQLNGSQIANLVALGWNLPTKNPDQSPYKSDPDGSPNFFREFAIPLQCKEIADMAVRTFTEVLAVSHPGFLEYNAFNIYGNSIALPELGLKREIADEEHEKKHAEALPKLLLETVKELTSIDDWDFDEDGDIGGIRYGNASTYVRCLKDRPYIRMHSVLLRDVKPTLPLLQRVNELNVENGHLHLIVRNNAVVALSDVLVTPFIASIVAHGLGNFCQIADEFSLILNAEFGEGAAFANQLTLQVVH